MSERSSGKQYRVIADITDSLILLLREACTNAGFRTIHLSGEVPKKDSIKFKPALNCHLYHIGFAPNYKERTQSLVSTQKDDGTIVEYYRDAPLYLYAHYIISVFGNNAKEEALLMGLAVRCFLETPMVEKDMLHGPSFYPDDKLNIYPDLEKDYNDVLSFWRSLSEEPRPAVYYHVKFRIESDRVSEPVRRVRSREVRPPAGPTSDAELP